MLSTAREPWHAAGRAARRVIARNPWTNLYGLARSLVAAGTALTLIFTSPSALWSPFFQGRTGPLGCDGIREHIALFCVVPVRHLAVAHWAAAVVLLVVASGWRPRLTGVPHWWISFSFLVSASRDGGDQVAVLFTLLLIPWTLTDDRRWHWDPPRSTGSSRPQAAFLAHTARYLVRLQVMVVYLHSAATKIASPEWASGSAVYYWVHDVVVGAGLVAPVARPLARSPAGDLLTWGAIVLELVLVAGLVLPRRAWRPLFWAGVAFHVAIALVLGITSFSVIMIGALVVYLRPEEELAGPPRFVRRRMSRSEQEATT